MVRSGATFADACAEYLRYIAEDRGRKASTVEDYRSIISVHLLPAFGETRLEDVSLAAVEAFQAELARREHRGQPITPRTRNKVLNVLHGVFVRDLIAREAQSSRTDTRSSPSCPCACDSVVRRAHPAQRPAARDVAFPGMDAGLVSARDCGRRPLRTIRPFVGRIGPPVGRRSLPQ
jgi:Phage integrase, N-terminal SAM-like domain